MLEKEDWQEQCCTVRQRSSYHDAEDCVRIPARQVVELLDQLLEKNNTEEAERHLQSWLLKARKGNDRSGELTVLNEMMGLYRSIGKEEEGLKAVEEGLALLEDMDLKESVTAGTTWINGATTLKAFGQAKRSLPLYEKAWRAYSSNLDPMDYRFAGLSNNMALAYVDLGDYVRAGNYYKRAISIMEQLQEGSMELAVTYVNLACMYDAWGHRSDLEGEETAPKDWDGRIWECLDRAMEYLEDPKAKRDGYYAFTCSKCAGTFGYFGQFRRKKELEARAEEIYSR